MTEDKAKNRTADEGETTPTPQSSQAGASRAPHEAAAHEAAPGAAPPPEAEAGPGEAGPGEAGPGEAILEEAVLEAAGPGEASLEDAGLPSQDEIAHLKDQILRALAETENLRRRAERERDEVAKYAVSGFARDILTVADNLRRALDAIPEDAREKDELLNNLAVGVEATERELMAAFERHGIRKIEPLGEKFNHDFHQAMFEVENTGKPPGTVVQLLQAGYVVHDRLLRPAMVGVAKGEPEARKVDTEA